MVYKNNPRKIPSIELNDFRPVKIPAHQTTEVYTEYGKVKMKIERRPIMMEELI